MNRRRHLCGGWNNNFANLFFCLIQSGSPAPKVKWFENGRELPTEANDFSYPSRTTNKLIVKNLSRIHQHAVYTCQASNFPNKFVTKNITIELYRKLMFNKQVVWKLLRPFSRFSSVVRPLEVEILFNNQPLSADRQYEVECQAIGSRPPSVITWWMNGIALNAQPTKVNWFLSSIFSLYLTLEITCISLIFLHKILIVFSFFFYKFIDISRWQRNNIDFAIYTNETRQWKKFGVSRHERAC